MSIQIPGWIKGAVHWVRSQIKTRSDLDKIQNRVDELEQRQRDSSAPGKPKDLSLTSGIYWGFFGNNKKKQPFCPACGASAKWVPLQRQANASGLDPGFVGFSCPVHSEHWFEIRLEEEAEALRN